jgi:hypothetical protein
MSRPGFQVPRRVSLLSRFVSQSAPLARNIRAQNRRFPEFF